MAEIDTTLTNVTYRYFLTDLVSNSVIGEVPFTGVSYERVLKKAGAFSGTIPVIEATEKLNIYEATMPGRTGIYVMRNDVCVWGGIIWARKYTESSKSLAVDASEFTSYFYHRHVWQTLIYGSEYIGISSFSVTNGVATIVTEIPHEFKQNNFVKITFTNPTVDGTHQVQGVSGANIFSFIVESGNVISTPISSGAVRRLIDTYDFVRDLIFQLNTDISVRTEARQDLFANDVIEPGISIESAIISKQRENGLITLRTLQDHQLVPGQEFESYELGSGLDGIHTVTAVPNAKTINYELSGVNISETPLSGIRTLYVTNKTLTNNVATITTHQPHGAIIGQTVVLTGVDSFFSERLDENFNGRQVITAVTTNTVTYVLTPPDGRFLPEIPTTTVSGGLATFGSKVIYGSYGPYTANSNLGIEVGTNKTSGLYQDTQILRGFELKTYGEILEDYANNLNGFEYRIDCDYEFTTASFTRTLTLLNIENPKEITNNVDVSDEERLGYNELIFEYPGNISTFTVEENAENSATRFFVEGDITDLSDEASQPYSVAADIYSLDNKLGKSWPLIDQVENINNSADEYVLYQYALEYLYESKPPMGDFSVTINGSLNPVVGTYYPGDWCSLIINDPFVLARLESDQEPRKDIIVRKINSFKVSVPDGPSFPETVDVELITDWKVDKVGQELGLTRPAVGEN